MTQTEDLVRRAVERLSEDESLAGDLSDIGFSPLLKWGEAAVQTWAAQPGAGLSQDSINDYTARVRGVIGAVVETAQAGKLDEMAPLLDFEAAQPAKTAADLKALTLGDDPDANAVSLAELLQAALPVASTKKPAPEPPSKDAEPSHPVTTPPPAPAEAKATPSTVPTGTPAPHASPASASGPARSVQSVATRAGAVGQSVKSGVSQAWGRARDWFGRSNKRKREG